MGLQEEEKDPLGIATEPFARSVASASTKDMKMTARILFASIVLGLVAGDGVGLMRSAVGAPSSAEAAGEKHQAETARSPYVAGQRIDGPYVGGIAGAGDSEGALLASTTVGGRRAPAADTEDVSPNGIAVGGLIANETFSVVGARFSRAFHDKWTEPEGLRHSQYTIRLQENPVPQFGAQVLVEIEGTLIFRAYLRPNRRQIQQAVQRAVQRATLYLQEYYEPREVY